MSIVSALLAAVLAAIALVACGSDDDSSTTAAAPTETTAPQQEPGVAPDGSEDEQQAGDSKSASNDSDSSDAGDGGASSGGDSASSEPASKGSPNSVAKGKTGPVRVSGGGSAPLVTKGGDNSIQEFGEEAEGELEAAAVVAHGYLVGRATENWPVACGYVSKGMQEQLEQLASGSAQLKGKGCPAVMAALTSGVSGGALTELTEVDALSLRSDGERGFLIYRSGDGTNYFMPMAQEDGAWKVSALASTPLS